MDDVLRSQRGGRRFGDDGHFGSSQFKRERDGGLVGVRSLGGEMNDVEVVGDKEGKRPGKTARRREKRKGGGKESDKLEDEEKAEERDGPEGYGGGFPGRSGLEVAKLDDAEEVKGGMEGLRSSGMGRWREGVDHVLISGLGEAGGWEYKGEEGGDCGR